MKGSLCALASLDLCALRSVLNVGDTTRDVLLVVELYIPSVW